MIAKLERDHDFRFFVSDDRYAFRPADDLGGETIEVEFANQLLSFRPRLTTVQQPGEVNVVGWDPAAKATINGNAIHR